MGRDQLQAGARLDGLQRPEDRRVPDRVWDRAHVQLGIPRTVDLTARAGVATAPGADVVRTRGAGLGRLAEQLVHATEQVMQRDARGRGQQRHHQVVLLGQVGVEDLPQGGGRRGSPEQVVDLCHVTQQLGQNLVLAEHRFYEQPPFDGCLRGRVQRLLLGQGVRYQFALAPVHQVAAGLLGCGRVASGGGREQCLGVQVQGAGQCGVVLLDRLGGVGVCLVRGDDEFGHSAVSLSGCFGTSTLILLHSVPWKIIGPQFPRG